MKKFFILIAKGMAMGAANVIPGVSGGTIALLTGIFEKLIHSIKSFDITALKLIFTGKFKAFAEHVNLGFLVAVFTGVAISLFSLARLLEYLFKFYPVYVWAFFFGLILASVYFVGKTIKKWTFGVVFFFVFGAAVAVYLAFMNPAAEDRSLWYLFVCGVVAVCSMILPGLSGSFVLVLMGNYELVMIHSVNKLDLSVLLPVALGAGIGLIGFSWVLSYVFKKFRDQTISLLTGFILGSLLVIWPWKEPVFKLDALGNVLTKASGEKIIAGYKWLFPSGFTMEVGLVILFVIIGIASIWLTEVMASKKAE